MRLVGGPAGGPDRDHVGENRRRAVDDFIARSKEQHCAIRFEAGLPEVACAVDGNRSGAALEQRQAIAIEVGRRRAVRVELDHAAGVAVLEGEPDRFLLLGVEELVEPIPQRFHLRAWGGGLAEVFLVR